MKNVRTIQYGKLREAYSRLSRMRHEVPSIDTINLLFQETMFNQERTPLSGGYRVVPYEPIDVNEMNVELALIKTDSESIYEFISEAQKKLRTIKYTSKVWGELARNRVSKAISRVARVTAPVFIKGFTDEIDTLESSDSDVTTAMISDAGFITMPLNGGILKKYKYETGDIVVRKYGNKFIPTIIGEPKSILNYDETESLLLIMEGNEVAETGFVLDIKTDIKGVNCIFIRMAESPTGIKVAAKISDDGINFITVCNSVFTRGMIDIPIETANIKKVQITITMDYPTHRLADSVRYEFRIHEIVFLNDKKKTECVYQTNSLAIESDVTAISIVTEDEVSRNSRIKYLISSDVDKNGDHIAFSTVKVNSTNLINLKSLSESISMTVDKEHRWNIKAQNKYGSRLYNLLDVIPDGTESDSYTITGRKLTFKTGITAMPETFTLRRGVGDYIKVRMSGEYERSSEELDYTIPVSDTTGWVKNIPLKLKVSEVVTETMISGAAGARNIITLPFIVQNYEEIRVRYSDGRQVSSEIINVDTASGTSTIITFTQGVGPLFLQDTRYTIDYIITLADYAKKEKAEISLDVNDIVIKVMDTYLYPSTDFNLRTEDMSIELLKTGKYASYFTPNVVTTMWEGNKIVNNTEPLVISFKYKESSDNERVFWRTFIYVDMPTDIIIIPFSSSEIAVGNFHSINDENVSTSSSYTLSEGWNKIESTQPHPCRSDLDPNPFTGKFSGAGIILHDGIGNQYPFIETMRQVSPFVLATMDPQEGSKCFAIENGQILVNFHPDSIEPVLMDDESTSYMTGKTMMCKRPVLESDYSNSMFEAYQEKFEFGFRYNSSAERKISIRAELSSDDSNSVVKIYKLGINKYKEVDEW